MPAAAGEVPRMNVKHAVAVVLVLGSCAATPAHAYIDPGTGSMLLQVIGAAVAGAIFYFRELRIRVMSLFSRRSSSVTEQSDDPPPGDAPR